jgi:hypothetical protein
MFCINCGTRLADGAAFCHSCGADLAAGPARDGPSTPAGRRPAFWLAMASVVLVAAGAGLVGGLLLGRGDDGSGTQVSALPSSSAVAVVEATPTPSVASPEDVARRWVQAQIDGDRETYIELVRPDHGDVADSLRNDLRGCDLARAEVLVKEVSISDVGVTVVFSRPCGTSVAGHEYKGCEIQLVRISGRWYVFPGAGGCWEG